KMTGTSGIRRRSTSATIMSSAWKLLVRHTRAFGFAANTTSSACSAPRLSMSSAICSTVISIHLFALDVASWRQEQRLSEYENSASDLVVRVAGPRASIKHASVEIGIHLSFAFRRHRLPGIQDDQSRCASDL